MDDEARTTFSKNKLPIFKQSVTNLGVQGASTYGGLKQYGSAMPQANSTSILERIKQANSIRKNYNSSMLSSHGPETSYDDQHHLGLSQQKSSSDISHEVNSVLSSSFRQGLGYLSEKNSKTVLKVSQIIRRVNNADTKPGKVIKVVKASIKSQTSQSNLLQKPEADYSWDDDTPDKKKLKD